MNCPYCQSPESKVVDSRTVSRDSSIRRRRECLGCQRRYTTYEYVMKSPLLVVKKNGQRVEFERQRVERSIRVACNKRPVSADQILDAAARVHKQIEDLGQAEIASAQIGDLVMETLRELDKVAYIRFASVYREFQDLGEFQSEIEQLGNEESR
ncbi:MAG: transcriptional repressor NrdR [Fidelibacterota bacterium]|nr:MAG: transcriptional repressor NrdR [Candidatus Neomarinimicrobiota bacterium]